VCRSERLRVQMRSRYTESVSIPNTSLWRNLSNCLRWQILRYPTTYRTFYEQSLTRNDKLGAAGSRGRNLFPQQLGLVYSHDGQVLYKCLAVSLVFQPIHTSLLHSKHFSTSILFAFVPHFTPALYHILTPDTTAMGDSKETKVKQTSQGVIIATAESTSAPIF